MAITRADNPCKRIRTKLYASLKRHLGTEAGWLQSHISSCPRCQRRLVSLGRVNLALSLMKARPHSLSLLMRANEQAIGVLKHGLRTEPRAAKLKTSLPEPKLVERFSGYGQSLGHVAACVTILLLMKMGVFSSVDVFQTEGQDVMKRYYARQVGTDLAEDVFPAPAAPSSSGNPRGAASA